MAIDFKKCPACKSKNGVKIVYGMPAPELIELAEKKKVHLGGCVVSLNQPDFHCNACNYEWTKKQAIISAYDEVKQVHFTIGGYFQGQVEIVIDFEKQQLSLKKGFTEEAKVHKLKNTKQAQARFRRTNVLNWKSKYVEPQIMDGEQWSLKLITEKRIIEKYGSNQYPREWGLFCYWLDLMLPKKMFKGRYNEQKASFEIDFDIDLS